MGPHGDREKISDPGGVRTHDLRNRSPLLYQLSYKARWELVLESYDDISFFLLAGMANVPVSIATIFLLFTLPHADSRYGRCLGGRRCKVNEPSPIGIDFVLCGDQIYYVWRHVCRYYTARKPSGGIFNQRKANEK